VCDYFGVKIALYFAYLGHYTTALLWPALLGTLLWLLSGTHQVNSYMYLFQYVYCGDLLIFNHLMHVFMFSSIQL